MRIAKSFDNFVSECPYFNGNSDVNNGYGCNHENQEEIDNGQGKCYCWSCPLGYPADEESLEEDDIEWEDGKPEVDEMEEDSYIILNDKDLER